MRYGTISRVPSTVAQRQSNRLLTDGSLVRIQSVELKTKRHSRCGWRFFLQSYPYALAVPHAGRMNGGHKLQGGGTFTSGERGIRTLGEARPHTRFRDEPDQPLWHLSN